MYDVSIGGGSYISNSIIGAHNKIAPQFSTETDSDLLIEMKGILHHADLLGTVMGDGNSVGNHVLVKAGKMISNNCNIGSGVTVQRDIPSGSIVV